MLLNSTFAAPSANPPFSGPRDGAQADANRQPKRKYNLPRGDAATMLQQFATISGKPVLFMMDKVKGEQTNAVNGDYSPCDALNLMLAGTALEITRGESSGGFVIHRRSLASKRSEVARDTAPQPPTKSEMTTNQQARKTLLSWLTALFVVANTGQAQVASSSQEKNKEPEKKTEEVVQLDTFTVTTGSRIKGVSIASPLVQVSQEDMKLSGLNDLGQVVRAIPQNFGGGMSPLMIPNRNAFGQANAGDFNNRNIGAGSSLNLRGLGADATITLLNGVRLPFAAGGGATDISVVPTIAVERLDVLLDGASAIYGADAVGGVANVVLRKNVTGAVVSARVGTATGGGYNQAQYSLWAGKDWKSGGISIAYDFSRNTILKIDDVDFFPSIIYNRKMSLIPEAKQQSGLISANQKLGSQVEFTVDAFYTHRTSLTDFLYPFGSLAEDDPTYIPYNDIAMRTYNEVKTKVWGVAPAMTVKLPGDWSARAYGFVGKNTIHQDQHQGFVIIPDQPPTAPFTRGRTVTVHLNESPYNLGYNFSGYRNKSSAYGLEVEGPVMELPAGTMRTSLGAGARTNDYINYQGPFPAGSSAATPSAGADHDRFGFAELNIPLVGEKQQIQGVQKLELNVAAREDKYRRYGSGILPKIGARWVINSDVTLKASWGKSFKAPLLDKQFGATNINIQPASAYGAPASVPSDALVIVTAGGNKDLKPERADTWSAGVTFTPSAVRGLLIELNWFDVNYRDRIALPIQPITAAWTDPKYHDFVIWNPTPAQVQAAIDWADSAGIPGTFFPSRPYDFSGVNLTKVIAILPSVPTNVSRDRLYGFDGSVRYTIQEWTLSGSVTHLIKGQRELVPGAPVLETIGRSFYPAKTRIRTGALWKHKGFSSSTNLSYVSGVTSSIDLVQKSGSMITVDQVFDYEFKSKPLRNVSVNLAVMNLFNQAPPYSANSLNIFGVAGHAGPKYTPQYDSTNYSALGRLASLSVTKRF